MREEEMFKTRQSLQVLEILKKMGVISFVAIHGIYQTPESAKNLIQHLVSSGVASLRVDRPDMLFYNVNNKVKVYRPVTDSLIMREKVYAAFRSLQPSWENVIPVEELYRELLLKGMSLDDVRDWRMKLLEERVISMNDKGHIIILQKDLRISSPVENEEFTEGVINKREEDMDNTEYNEG